MSQIKSPGYVVRGSSTAVRAQLDLKIYWVAGKVNNVAVGVVLVLSRISVIAGFIVFYAYA